MLYTCSNHDEGWLAQVTLKAGERKFMCMCGQSANFPFCDGSHKAVNARLGTKFAPKPVSNDSSEDKEVRLCVCGHSQNRYGPSATSFIASPLSQTAHHIIGCSLHTHTHLGPFVMAHTVKSRQPQLQQRFEHTSWSRGCCVLVLQLAVALLVVGVAAQLTAFIDRVVN